MSTAIAPVEKLSAAQLDQLCINTIRTLSIDAVQQANSGHPGTPMALAPLVYTIWNRVMQIRSAEPDLAESRPLRAVERPCLDAALVCAPSHRRSGRECRLRNPGQPSVTLDDIRRFRQLDSKAPGHPEYHWVSGVETTTGPLGQGVGNERGHGDRGKVARPPLQPAGLRDLRLQHLYGLRRRLPDGRHCVRSCVTRRTSGAR